jgi:Reverse transcriptase (RNA-dependent DNA polymerase)
VLRDHSLIIATLNQSAYPSYHSTETNIVSAHNDMIGIVDKGHVVALVLLDISSAFDTVDHDILVSVLQQQFGIQDPALDWFADLMTDHSQSKSVATHHLPYRLPMLLHVEYCRGRSLARSSLLHTPKTLPICASTSTPSCPCMTTSYELR